ncbi:MAG: hypothetical protein Ta2B_05520 [Termitinemataceae bacterium]|nr:MAG: hypothetical protein Ta2B_05520 [Termitinemataceae bacterium]
MIKILLSLVISCGALAYLFVYYNNIRLRSLKEDFEQLNNSVDRMEARLVRMETYIDNLK